MQDAGDEDCTAVIAMSKNFNRIVPSSRNQHPIAGMLNFEDDVEPQIPPSIERLASVSKRTSSISMKEVLEKENEDRLVRIQLEKAEKTIAQQKQELTILEADLKSLQLRYDKDKREFAHKEQVICNRSIQRTRDAMFRYSPSVPLADSLQAL